MSSHVEAANFIRENNHFILTTHVFPDGDNMGCVLALSEGLKQLGKDFAVYIEGELPSIYTWMPGSDIVRDSLTDALASLNGSSDSPLLLVVDSGDITRTGDAFGEWLESVGGVENLQILNVDHHVSNTYFGTLNWVDAEYSSVGEMIYEILKELGVKLTPGMAQNLYTAVYTDTGRFSFSNTNEKSLRYASEYITAGAKPNKSYSGIYASRSMASFQLESLSFNTLSEFLDGNGCYFWIDREMLAQTGTTMYDTEGFLDSVRTLRGYRIVVFFKEIGETDIRVSVRAAPPIAANKLMKIFGGGGHPRAAGCRINMKLEDARNQFISVAEKEINSGTVQDD